MIMRQPAPIREGIEAALDGVNQRVRRAFETTHERLAELGIPHVLIGGLAVGVHGYQYATQDVDWLVTAEKAFEGTTVLTYKPGIPIRAENVNIDYLTPEGPPSVIEAMEAALATSEANPGHVVVVPVELLVWMKLKAGRGKDTAAIIELLHTGQDGDRIRAFLVTAGNKKVLDRFDAAVQKAAEEDDEPEDQA